VRPRELYACAGPQGLGDVELVALLLGTGSAGRCTLSIAGDLVDRFGGLAGLAQAEPTALQGVPGVGPARAVRVHAALEAGRRATTGAGVRPDPVITPDEAVSWLRPALVGLPHEELHALYLDRRGRPLARRLLTRGSDGFTVVDPRQIFRPAVALGAVSVILAHNHPSGDPTPSAMDREVTRRTTRAGGVLGIQLADHLVFGGEAWVSMAAEGLVGGSWG
jgi:DNA repair protein RadC